MESTRNDSLRKAVGYASVLAVGVVLQTTWAHSWKVMGTYPDLYVVLSVCTGLTLGVRRAATVGMLLGYMEGIMLGDSIGSYMVSRALVAVLAGGAETRVYRDNVWVSLIAVFVGTLVAESAFLIMSPNYPFPYWAMTILRESLFNGLLALPFFLPLSNLAVDTLHYAPVRRSRRIHYTEA